MSDGEIDEPRSNPPSYRRNLFLRFGDATATLVTGPVKWFKETVVEPNQKQYPWYHRQFRRVPTIDQCYSDDIQCIYEANHQFKRDRGVESEIINVLRQRREDCFFYEFPDQEEKCAKALEEYENAVTNWFTKYGDLGYAAHVIKAMNKQKHRMVWERRHGEVGTGKRSREDWGK